MLSDDWLNTFRPRLNAEKLPVIWAVLQVELDSAALYRLPDRSYRTRA